MKLSRILSRLRAREPFHVHGVVFSPLGNENSWEMYPVVGIHLEVKKLTAQEWLVFIRRLLMEDSFEVGDVVIKRKVVEDASITFELVPKTLRKSSELR